MSSTIESKRFRFEGQLWQHPGTGGWHFVTLTTPLSKRIKAFVAGDAAAWGSVKVEVQINETKWNTSIFPDRKRGAYLLPIKGRVRKELAIGEGDVVRGTASVQCERVALLD